MSKNDSLTCKAGGEHQWSQWKSMEKSSCEQSRFCLKCHETEEKEAHDWIATQETEDEEAWWGDNSRRLLTYQIYKCARCQKIERVLVGDRA